MIKNATSRYLLLDAWRGVACLMVIFFHSTFFDEVDSLALDLAKRMWVGVPMFFVISGYCISATADSTRLKGGGVATYFRKRFRRIYPPYWASLVVLALFTFLVSRLDATILSHKWEEYRLWWLDWGQLFGNLTLTERWLSTVRGLPSILSLNQAWTLCYEEQFYAVVGVILLVWPKHFFRVALVITIATLPLFGNPSVKGFFFDGYWLSFALGILVYHAMNYQSRSQVAMSIAVLLAVTAYAGLPLHETIALKPNDKWQSLCAAGAFSLVLMALRPFDKSLANLPALKPLMLCGLATYSIYLVHWPLVKVVSFAMHRAGIHWVVTVAVCTALSLAAGWAFYMLVERRFLNVPQKSTSPVVQVEQACVVGAG